MSSPLEDRRALVTGAGRGLGAAIALGLARAGASVALVARTGVEIEAVAAQIRAAGGRAIALPTDVTDESAVGDLARRAAAAFGPIEVLVNDAGTAASAPLPRITLDDWNRVLAVNATAAFLTMRAFLPAMLAADWGRIVNVASTAGLAGARYIAHYAASKHALLGLTRAAAAEVEGTGVGVHAVCPGYADTSMTEATVANVRERTGRSAADALAAVLAAAGQRRLVTPAEVADTVVSLCSRATNGEIVVLAGAGDADFPLAPIHPARLGEAKGFSHGVVAPPGARLLFVAGQPGWSSTEPGEPADFATQFARALDRCLTVVREAGGEAGDVARLTIYVSDLAAYRAARRALGPLWRERFGTYDPAVALVEVRGLVDQGAIVEIEATAVLGGNRRP